ncbi:MAG: branched-chain amino acid ABC transporter permease [Chloroflexi bacterium]|nr:branched-chain amino acid ABC transporter permease [Chloroflexota bacterium]
MDPQQIANGLFQGAVYALFALGFTLVFGVLDILNLAHASVFMWAAMIAWFLVTSLGVPFFLALLLATLAAGLMGLLLDLIAFRPLRRRGAEQLAALISSLGMVAILDGAALSLMGPQTRRFPPDAFPNDLVHLGPIVFSAIQPINLLIALALMVGLHLTVRRTSLGRQMRAVAENPRTAALLGVNVDRVIAITFVAASALGGAAGVLFGATFNAIWFEMGARMELKGLTIIILGGMGSVPGAVAGGFLLGLIEVFSVAFLSSGLRDAVAFTVMFLILLVRPSGLFGQGAGRVG